MKNCSAENCNNKHYGKGLCKKHYQRQPHILKIKNDWQKNNLERRSEILHNYHVGEKHKKTSAKYRSTLEGRYNKTQRSAKERNKEFNLTFEEFSKILEKEKCHYCGVKIGPGSGLDRKDNKVGYIKENVVTCCSDCNYLKQDLLTEQETLEIIKLLKQLRNKEDIWL